MTDNNLGIVEDLFKTIRANDISAIESIIHGHPQLTNIRFYSEMKGTATPLMEACASEKPAVVKFLLRNGADVTTDGFTRTVHSQDILGRIVMYSVGRSQGGYGASDDDFPLFISSRRHCNASIVQDLLEAGAPVNQTNGCGQSALHATCMNYGGHEQDPVENELPVIVSLIENGALVNLQDKNGKTPLHYACDKGNERNVKILIENGANVNIRDDQGISALEMAAQVSFKLMETMIQMCEFSTQEIIEAYEIAAFGVSHHQRFEWLCKATTMRAQHKVPKPVLQPLECYGFAKEWETLEELQHYKNNQYQLKLQTILARERIFSGRYVNFKDHQESVLDMETSNRQRNALLNHELDLFVLNNGYMYFADDFLRSGRLLDNLLCLKSPMDYDVISKTAKVALESCYKIHEALNVEAKPHCIEELISQIERSLLTIGLLITHLLSTLTEQSTAKENHWNLIVTLFSEVLQKFPEVTCKVSGYRAPLAHILFSSRYNILMSTFSYDFVLNRCGLAKLLLDNEVDLNTTDSDGNSLLNIIVAVLPHDYNNFSRSAPQNDFYGLSVAMIEVIVELLLHSGVYLHTKNKMRKTVMDIISDPRYKICFSNTRLMDLMTKYDSFPALTRLAATMIRQSSINYHAKLPKKLINFVDLH